MEARKIKREKYKRMEGEIVQTLYDSSIVRSGGFEPNWCTLDHVRLFCIRQEYAIWAGFENRL